MLKCFSFVFISFVFILLVVLTIFIYNKKSRSNYFSKLDYLKITDNDLDMVNINDRWKLRSSCLNKFSILKNEYAIKKHIYPLPSYINNDLIFINLASYRDKECPNTINSLISQSSNWENLRINICQQNSEEDTDALDNLEDKYNKIISINRISYLEARGPTYARFLIQQKYSGEEYYLQIDSHTIFENNWDDKLKKSLNNLIEINNTDKCCLTQYLPQYSIGNTTTTSKLRGALKVESICSLDGFTRITSPQLDVNLKYPQPFPSTGWSGCFSFSKGNICIDAPIDPYTPDVFFGEEMDICLRLYTRGWNFYSPNFPIAYTNFDRGYRDTFWEKKGKGYNKDITLCSRLRIHYRLGTLNQKIKKLIETEYLELLIEQDMFKLGDVRTLKDYEKLIKFNFNTEKKN